MLNYFTLLLVLIVFTSLTTLLLIAAALQSDALAEQRLWASGNVAISAGFVVGAMTSAPLLIHAGLSYALIGFGLAVVLRGLRQFCGRPMRWKWVAAITLGSFLLPAYFALVTPDKAARLMVSGVSLGALCWACSATLLNHVDGSARGVMWPSAAGFFAVGLVMVLRGVYLFSAPLAIVQEQTIDTIASISVLTAAVGQVTIAFGLIMLVSHRYSERLGRLTMMDGLTGVLNRVGMERMADRVLMRARQSQRPVSVVMVDADWFKRINDTYGHPAGDVVLVHLARILAEQVRPGDLVIRYGGEEFVLLLDDSGEEAARLVAERLRKLIEGSHVSTGAGKIAYQVSIGVSCSEKAGYALEDLVMQADLALYRAKQDGRNRVCVA